MSTSWKKSGYEDLESGQAGLYPGITAEDNVLRWAFIRKVYGILSTQMVLTTAVASVVVFSTPVKEFFVSSPWLLITIAFLPLILMCPLYAYHQSHPLNLVLLGFFTVAVSLTVGISCAFTDGLIVLEALLLTATVVLSLTAYTYWAAKNGYDFSFLGPILFVSVIVLVVFGLVQMIFPLGPISTAIYGGLGALIFSVYIVYDTDNLIKRYTYDEYIWASVALYLDVINLFLSILQLLRSIQGGNN
jgi:FtsH-binding integral membrane protein